MNEYQRIAVELTGIFKRKALERMTGASDTLIGHLRSGFVKRPRDNSVAEKLKMVYDLAKANLWI